jgi:hypothetical protein
LSWVEMQWQTISRPIRLGIGHPFGAHDQIFSLLFFFRAITLLLVLGRPLWREDGAVICSAICQWSESRRTQNYTLLSHLRLLGSVSIAPYDSQGLRWKSLFTKDAVLNHDDETCISQISVASLRLAAKDCLNARPHETMLYQSQKLGRVR